MSAAAAWAAGAAAVAVLAWYALRSGAAGAAPVGAARTALAYEDGQPAGVVELELVDGVELVRGAAAAFRLMQSAAKAAGVALRPTSGFRRMEDQQRLYQDLLEGRRTAAVARPGYSNHQRGRVDRVRRRGPAVDIAVGGAGSEVHRWLVGNAGKYGFDDAEGRAVNEPWHWVYLGEQA